MPFIIKGDDEEIISMVMAHYAKVHVEKVEICEVGGIVTGDGKSCPIDHI